MKLNLIAAALLAAAVASCVQEPTPPADSAQEKQTQAPQEPTAPAQPTAQPTGAATAPARIAWPSRSPETHQCRIT